MAQFCERLKLLRKEAGLSQQEFSKYLKVSKSSVNMYERGEREPSLETLEAIADHFNVDMDYLLGKSDYRNKTHWLMGRTNEQNLLDIIAEQCGHSAAEAATLYNRLDVDDQGEVRGEMKQMLKADKYAAQKESLGGAAI